MSGGSAPNYGLIFVPLKSIDLRKGKGHSAGDIVQRLSPKMFGVPGGLIVVFEPPAVQGIGSFGGFEFQLQDLGRNTLQDLAAVAQKIVGASRQRKDLTNLYSSYTANDPQLLLQIDREKAKAMSVLISEITKCARRLHGFCSTSTISTSTTVHIASTFRRINLFRMKQSDLQANTYVRSVAALRHGALEITWYTSPIPPDRR